jgi:hypothetical protein
MSRTRLFAGAAALVAAVRRAVAKAAEQIVVAQPVPVPVPVASRRQPARR